MFRNQFGKEMKNAMLLAWGSIWADGFGANCTKQNRNPIQAKTMTMSPTKNRINAIDKTFPIAVGLKKRDHPKVDRHFAQDIKKLTNARAPFWVLHGRLQKILPIYFDLIVSITDKVEKAEMTGTLSHSSDHHKRFGKAIKLEPHSVKSESVASFLKEPTSHRMAEFYGWSSHFLGKD